MTGGMNENGARLAGDDAEVVRVRLDLGRRRRTGVPEVVFAERKTLEDTRLALEGLVAEGGFALATRLPEAHAEALVAHFAGAARWSREARALRIGELPHTGFRAGVLCAGTSDLPVAEEAAFVLEAFGHTVLRRYDVGVAGLHRLFEGFEAITACEALVVVAGMEGALPSVVAGVVDVPVIAVPTSVGYGAAFEGIAALLGMLTSCAPGIGVVNIDNGFGAAAFVHKLAGAGARIAAR